MLPFHAFDKFVLAYACDRCQINIPYTRPYLTKTTCRVLTLTGLVTELYILCTNCPKDDPKRRDIMLLSHVPIQGHCRDKHNASRSTHAHTHTIQSSVINTSRRTHSASLMPLRFIGGYGCVSNHLQLFSPHLARLSLTTTAASTPHPSATPKQ